MIVKQLIMSAMLIAVAQFTLAEKVRLEEKVQVVNYVDNQQGIVVAGDMEYKLKIGTKVSDDSGRALNRYALKPGQSIVANGYYEKQQVYLDSIVILNKKK